MASKKRDNPTKGLWLRGEIWWLSATIPGFGLRRISLKTGDMAEAIVEARKVRLFPERYFDVQSKSIAEEFLKHQEKRGISFAHLKQTRAVLKEVEEFSGLPLQDLRESVAQKWWLAVSKRVKAKSAKDYLGQLTVFYKWAVASGAVKTSPLEGIVRPKVRPTPRRVFLTPHDAIRVLDACPDDNELKFCLYCALHCGLRRGEVIAARSHWFDLKAGLLHVQNEDDWLTKDRDNRTIPLTTEFRVFLRTYGIRHPYMFRPDVADNKNKKAWQYRTDFKKGFLAHMEKLSLKGVTFHDLRRTFASLHASKGTPLFHIARWLGDDPSVVEKTYAHLLPNDQRINDPWVEARAVKKDQ